MARNNECQFQHKANSWQIIYLGLPGQMSSFVALSQIPLFKSGKTEPQKAFRSELASKSDWRLITFVGPENQVAGRLGTYFSLYSSRTTS